MSIFTYVKGVDGAVVDDAVLTAVGATVGATVGAAGLDTTVDPDVDAAVYAAVDACVLTAVAAVLKALCACETELIHQKSNPGWLKSGTGQPQTINS